ncbi:MAG: AbrB/MazE/SpoVT family DNA-binding domain-containing protein [Oscillospiraceae bacterium]
MKKTGIIRKTDALGRIVLPVEIRKTMNIVPFTPMEIFINDDGSFTMKRYDINIPIATAFDNFKTACDYLTDDYNKAQIDELLAKIEELMG